jgi:hypothetical protein
MSIAKLFDFPTGTPLDVLKFSPPSSAPGRGERPGLSKSGYRRN